MAYYVDWRDRKLALSNIAKAFPDYDKNQVVALAKKTFRGSLYSFGEMAHLMSGGTIRLDMDKEFFRNLVKEHPTMIFMSAHLGNWEMMPSLTQSLRHKIDLRAIARPLSNKFLDQYIVSIREELGVEVIPRSRKKMRQMVTALRKADYLAFIGDQSIKNNHQIWVPFFGRPAPTPNSIAVLAAKRNLPIQPVFCLREKFGSLRVDFDECIYCSKNQSPEEITRKYTCIIEKNVRKSPEQWVWYHNRWKEKIRS